MRIDILTLFPNMFEGFINESIIKRATQNKKVDINIINFRDYATNKHKKVDDYPYGGGSGMLLMCEPIFNAIDDLKKENTKVILMSPGGIIYNQKLAYELKELEHIIIICGHYEGFDERIKTLVDIEISIGEYVLTGGELPSMIITDSIVRLIDGVIKKESLESETYTNDLADYPNYTKPSEFRGLKVPEVLLNGNHKEIEAYRQEEIKKKTENMKKVGD